MQPVPGEVSTQSPPWQLHPVGFDRIAGWAEDDHVQALACFRISARRMAEQPYRGKALGIDPAALAGIGSRALRMDAAQSGDGVGARQFFEDHFRAFAIEPASGSGFVTGYFEPQVAASPVRTGRFAYPLYRRPPDLLDVAEAEMPLGWNREIRFARKSGEALVEYHDRAAIEAGALAGRGLELAWIESPVDGFFIHIQGSARLLMPDGAVRRISYAGKSGHPFTAIGRVLIELGELERETLTMQAIRDWLTANPSQAGEIMNRNRSFIFFAETGAPVPELGPVAAAAVQLTPGRSLAIDRTIHTFATPIFVSTRQPLAGHQTAFRRLMIAQDTGSAIIGVARGDLFIGSGQQAGEIAGAIRHAADFHVLMPAMAARSPGAAG